MEQDLRQGDEQAEDQPDVYHLDVGCSWHRVEHTDEERGEDEEEGDIHGDNDIKICRLPNEKNECVLADYRKKCV